MKGFISTMGIMWLGFYISVNLFSFYTDVYLKDSVVLTMIESGKIASVQGLDNSSRVSENTAEITQESFENVFENEFKSNLNVKVAIEDIKYEYVKRDHEIKAVYVKVFSKDGQQYQTAIAENLSITG